MYKIYVLKHPITDEIRYVGRTSYSLEQRLKGHLNHCKGGSTVYRCNWINSLLKEGLIPKIELIDTYESWKESGKEEINLIRKLKSEGIKLINTTEGGDGNLGCRIKQFDKEGNLLKIWESIAAIENELGLSNSHISGCCNGRRGRRTLGGFIWRYEKDDFNTHPTTSQFNITEAQKKALSLRQKGSNNVMALKKGKLHPSAQSILQLDDDNNIIKEWETIKEAQEKLNISNISRACKKGYKTKGYYWKYNNNEDIVRTSEKSENTE